MEGDPFMLIEGMAIAGFAVGATRAMSTSAPNIRTRSAAMSRAIETARAHGLLGADFDIEVRVGAGAYVCGEETALLESIEGKRGEVRAKPPLPAIEGLFGQPTIINNVLTLAAVPFILAEGAKAYADYGMGRSRGTMPIQLAGNIKNGGLFETALRHHAGRAGQRDRRRHALAAGRCAPCRSAGRWAPISRPSMFASAVRL